MVLVTTEAHILKQQITDTLHVVWEMIPFTPQSLMSVGYAAAGGGWANVFPLPTPDADAADEMMMIKMMLNGLKEY